jgi:hypothetical protein
MRKYCCIIGVCVADAADVEGAEGADRADVACVFVGSIVADNVGVSARYYASAVLLDRLNRRQHGREYLGCAAHN